MSRAGPKRTIRSMATRPDGATTPVRDALERITATHAGRGFNGLAPAAASVRDAGRGTVAQNPSGLIAAAIAGLLVLGAFAAATAPWLRAGCEPITYAFEGSPPAQAAADFGLAVQEVHKRSGLVFGEGAPGRSKLRVVWSDHELPTPAPSPMVSGHDTARFLAVGGGLWQSAYGGRQLVNATIKVDGNASWGPGMERGDGLAAVFVHELGHVIGLPHSPDPASFMYDRAMPRVPRWTTYDLEGLAEAGRQAGCAPLQRAHRDTD